MENIKLGELKESWPTAVSVVSTSQIEMTIKATNFWQSRFQELVDSSKLVLQNTKGCMFHVSYAYDECYKTLKGIREAVDVVNDEIEKKIDYVARCQDEANRLFKLRGR